MRLEPGQNGKQNAEEGIILIVVVKCLTAICLCQPTLYELLQVAVITLSSYFWKSATMVQQVPKRQLLNNWSQVQ